MISVLIENSYTDGHESTEQVEIVVPPEDLSEDGIAAWFDDVVFEHTGDGHYSDVFNETDGRVRLGSCYTATVLKAPGFPPLEGRKFEWLD